MAVEGEHGLEARVTSPVSPLSCHLFRVTFPVSLWIALLYGSMFNGRPITGAVVKLRVGGVQTGKDGIYYGCADVGLVSALAGGQGRQ